MGDQEKGKLVPNMRLQRSSTAREFANDTNLLAAKYTQEYLHRNKLGMYLKGYKKLDDIINLFFINYAKLDRSSLNCARLWVAVMQCRTQMTNAITHLVDQPRFIAVEYKNLRMSELHQHIYPCRMFVAKAVQYIVTFIKHKDEDWRFLRKGFLEALSNHLSNALFSATSRWTEFIIDAYELQPHTIEAYKNHLKNQEYKCRLALKVVEPESSIAKRNKSLERQLDQMYNERNTEKVKKDNYYAMRKMLNAVSDCLGTSHFITQTEFDHDADMSFNVTETENDTETVDTVKSFLKREINQIIIDDDKVWPHQKGLEDLGPFQLVGVPHPELYFDVDLENSTYMLKPEMGRVNGLSIFKNKVGQVTKPCAISFSKSELKALGINTAAKTYCWLFPLYANVSDNEMAETFNFANDLSPLHVACLYGSFAYYDAKGKLLTVKGVTMGDDLFFDGPYFIPNSHYYQDLQAIGVRFEKVTLKNLLEVDAREFAWVNPGQDKPFKLEEVKGGSNQAINGWDFRGAFTYTYDNEGKNPELQRRRNYFQVLTFQEIKMKKAKNVNTPVVSSLNILYHTYEAQWRDLQIKEIQANTWSDMIFQSTRALNRDRKMWWS